MSGKLKFFEGGTLLWVDDMEVVVGQEIGCNFDNFPTLWAVYTVLHIDGDNVHLSKARLTTRKQYDIRPLDKRYINWMVIDTATYERIANYTTLHEAAACAGRLNDEIESWRTEGRED